MSTRRTRSLLPWLGLLVSAVFAYLAVRNVRLADVWSALRTSNYWWLLPAFAMLAVSVAVKAVRWHFMFAEEMRPPLGTVLRSTLVGFFFNSVLPVRSGEAARVITIKRWAGTPLTAATATVVLERVYEVLTLLVLLFVAVPWLPHVTWLRTAAILAVALTAALVVSIALLAAWGLRPLHAALRPLGRLPFVPEERLEHIGDGLGQGLVALRRPKLILAAIFWSVCSWLSGGVSMWLVLLGFHLHLSFAAGLLVLITTNLALILPSSPSGIGVFEAAAIVALRAYGVPNSQALSCALVVHALNFLPYVAVGPFVLRGRLELPHRRNMHLTRVSSKR